MPAVNESHKAYNLCLFAAGRQSTSVVLKTSALTMTTTITTALVVL